VGVGGIVVGAVFAGNSNSAHDDQEKIKSANGGHACLDPTSAQCKQFNSKGDDVKSAATISYVGYIAGGVGLAGALVWTGYNLFSGGKADASTDPAKVTWLPWLGREGGGASMKISF